MSAGSNGRTSFAGTTIARRNSGHAARSSGRDTLTASPITVTTATAHITFSISP